MRFVKLLSLFAGASLIGVSLGSEALAARPDTPPFGTDTRAMHAFPSPGFEYAGGYLADFNERALVPNGQTSSTLSTTFVGSYAGQPLSASAYADANLATGKLRAYATDPIIFVGALSQASFDQARSNASFEDTLNFKIDPSLAGHNVNIGIRTVLDGSYSSTIGTASGTVALNQIVTLTSAHFSGSNINYFYNKGFGATSANFLTNMTNYGGNVWGFDIGILPESFSLHLIDLLSVNAYGSTVDYSHTASLGLVLPEGVTYTSSSGVFLTDRGPAGVPEPASWALMIAGFGAVGATLRHRRMATSLMCAVAA